jgi:cytochrome c2
MYGVRSLALLIMLLLTGCQSAVIASGPPAGAAVQAPQIKGVPENGKLLFENPHGEAPACATCHYVDRAETLVGPSLQTIARRAGSQVAGLDAVSYLRQSILEPDAFVADGQPVSRMYMFFGKALTPQQIDDLVAYLMTLK